MDKWNQPFAKINDTLAEQENWNSIKGAYLFGSNVRGSRDTCASGEAEIRNGKSDSEIDFLVICERKSVLLKKLLDETFSDFGEVIHHPDPYSPRLRGEPIIEMIVLPVNSQYLARVVGGGILTGISAFSESAYVSVYGEKKLDRLIELPPKRMGARFRREAFLKAVWGIADVMGKLWPLLNRNHDAIDIRRLGRFFVADYAWVLTGHWREKLPDALADIRRFEKDEAIIEAATQLCEFSKTKPFDPDANCQHTAVLYRLAERLFENIKQ